MSYTPPSFNGSAFHCPRCGVYAHMTWKLLFAGSPRQGFLRSGYVHATCSHCRNSSCWLGSNFDDLTQVYASGRMIDPAVRSAPLPHADMPKNVMVDYKEAMEVHALSPRAAAALLRLAIQKLCKHLGESGENINADIGQLVRKGLSVEIQQALDVVRVVGNNAVHPGELSADDVATVSNSLFELVNHIVEERISRPKKLAEMFSALPDGAKDGVEARDRAARDNAI